MKIQMFEAVLSIEQCGGDVTQIIFDPRLVVFTNPLLISQQFKLSYFPFPFLHRHHLNSKDFAHHIYSPAHLRLINLQESHSHHPYPQT